MASSLALRLQSAQCEAAAYERHGRAAYRTDAPVLPIALARTYLLDHPLPHALGVGVADVHRALLALHCHVRASGEGGGGAGPVDGASASADRVRHVCAACGGAPSLDEREGCYVCDGCGAVLSRSVNVVPEYMAPPELPPEQLRQRGVPGVPQSVLDRDEACRIASMDAAEVASRAAARLWRADLDRWNHLVHLGTDDLRYTERLLGEWSATGHAREARLAAALLYPLVRDQIPEAHEVRRWVQQAATLPAKERPAHARAAMPGFVDRTPAPRFACRACGVMRHSRRDARFHCRTWGGGGFAARGKRRRP